MVATDPDTTDPDIIGRARLRQASLRPTRQRVALSRLLFGSGDRHITAEQLHAEARQAGVKISLATVYNTLGQFCAAGFLKEMAVHPRRTYYDTNLSSHHHLYYEESGTIEDIPAHENLADGLSAIPAEAAVKQVDVIIRLTGTPPDRKG